MRIDKFLRNDSGAFSLCSRAVLESLVADKKKKKLEQKKIVARHDAIIVGLAGDDSPMIRVVVGEKLHDDERDEWLSRRTGRLNVEDGVLVISAGFSSELIGELVRGDDLDDQAHEIDVEPGTYLVDIYTHAPSMSGVALLEAEGIPLGTRFREDHPDAPIPLWVANQVCHDPEENDPGFEREWASSAAAISEGQLELAKPMGYVGYVIHLRPNKPDAKIDDPDREGIFEYDEGARALDTLPMGIESDHEDPELVTCLESLLEGDLDFDDEDDDYDSDGDEEPLDFDD